MPHPIVNLVNVRVHFQAHPAVHLPHILFAGQSGLEERPPGFLALDDVFDGVVGVNSEDSPRHLGSGPSS